MIKRVSTMSLLMSLITIRLKCEESRCCTCRGLRKSRLSRKSSSAWLSHTDGAWQTISWTRVETWESEMFTKSCRLRSPPFLGHMFLRWTPKPLRITCERGQRTEDGRLNKLTGWSRTLRWCSRTSLYLLTVLSILNHCFSSVWAR